MSILMVLPHAPVEVRRIPMIDTRRQLADCNRIVMLMMYIMRTRQRLDPSNPIHIQCSESNSSIECEVIIVLDSPLRVTFSIEQRYLPKLTVSMPQNQCAKSCGRTFTRLTDHHSTGLGTICTRTEKQSLLWQPNDFWYDIDCPHRRPHQQWTSNSFDHRTV